MKRRLVATMMVCLGNVAAGAGLVTGLEGRSQFDALRVANGDTLETFESQSPQTNLTTQIPGVTFRSLLQRTNPEQSVDISADGLGATVWCSPQAPHDPTCSNEDHVIGGLALPGGGAAAVADGQTRWELVFSEPQQRAGLQRRWNGEAITRFFHNDTLLAERQAVGVNEFVGYIADSIDGSDWVTRIEFDGNETEGNIFQTGNIDDLMYSSQGFTGLVFGANARAYFDMMRATQGDMLVDFEAFEPQTRITNDIPGVALNSLLPERHVMLPILDTVVLARRAWKETRRYASASVNGRIKPM